MHLWVERGIQRAILLATWRLTQGIYRFHDAVYDAVIETPLNSGIPCDVLARMPEWVIYVETQEMVIDDYENIRAFGFWVMLDEIDGESAITIFPDMEKLGVRRSILCISIALSINDLGESLNNSINNYGNGQIPEGQRKAFIAYVGQAINLLLYICTQNDIAPRIPTNPAPVKTRRHGFRHFPADNPTTWEVGVRMGAALAAAYARYDSAEADGDGERHVRPHIRRAHWHGFRTGPRIDKEGAAIPAEKRRFDLRWLPPIPVGLDDPDARNAVIRAVG
jgi:hypothetical protein